MIVGCATLVVEQKFIRDAALCGHIEDVVTDKSVRGKGIGRLLTKALIQLGRDVGCYKIILDCNDDNVAFYERCGMRPKERQMVIYLNEEPKAKL
jgi:glucosamine-phosphate N-acetyltransferase